MAVNPPRRDQKFRPFRVTVKKQARRHVGEQGTAVAVTPHGFLISLDKHRDMKEVFDGALLSRD